MTKDPVCGMTIDEKAAAARQDYEGTTYHFCSEACRQTFQADPGRYAKPAGGG
jgi:Cu+-exporting ATPase